MKTGKVYLVGAGPGDPELITRRGAKLLRQAGCVIYDRLVDPALLRLAPPKARRIYAGKESAEGGRGQGRIHRLMAHEARRHEVVVRLKGGDPSLFGRVSEETKALARAGIPYEIVPGVSSAWASAACAGIPLTDRRLSSSVAITTGHAASGKKFGVRWEALARGADTLVILMGRSELPGIVKRMRKVRPGSTPIALVRWATTREQEVLVSTLDRVEAELNRRPGFSPPVTAIVGEVVRRSQELRGASSGPALAGKRVLVTRPKEDEHGLGRRLEGLGARCEYLPTIRIRRKSLAERDREALRKSLPGYDWWIFTSHHAVEALIALTGKRLKTRAKICAVGPRTVQAARQAGLKPALVPQDSSKAGIARAFSGIPLRGRRLFIPRSSLGAGDWFAGALRRRGAQVDEVVLYETVEPAIPAARLKKAVRHLDAATFTSGSTARSFVRALARAGVPLKRALNGAAVVAIGPSTAQALKRAGVRKVHLPKDSWTVDGLVEAVVEAVR